MDIRAIGRIKTGPERDILDRYMNRATGAGRAIGLGPVIEHGIDLRTFKTKRSETAALTANIPAGALIFALDETGESLSSVSFARILERARDEGTRSAVFLIGGANGYDPINLPSHTRLISFGKATWPHKLVRVMLAEQIYRAVSVLAGAPYHREG